MSHREPGATSPPSPPARPPSAVPATVPPTEAAADPVEAEWERIERERVSGEIAEAREDVLEAIAEPRPPAGRRRLLWTALAIALVAGMVFAAGIDRFVVRARREVAAPSPPPTRRPPSPSETGSGIGGDEAEADDSADTPADAAATGGPGG